MGAGMFPSASKDSGRGSGEKDGFISKMMKQKMQKAKQEPSKTDGGSNFVSEKLAGVSKDIKQSGTDEDAMMLQAFGKKIMRNGLPVIDTRKHDDIKMTEWATMNNRYPGGDVMYQSMWSKWRNMGAMLGKGPTLSGQYPPEEDWYSGARLGEYARPLVMGPGKVGYLNQAPVPMSQSEDLLTLVSEAGVGSRRSRNAAIYAKQSAGQAMEFFRLAQRRARQIFHDPPVSVLPGADIWPMYSASVPVVLVPPPPKPHRFPRPRRALRKRQTLRWSNPCSRCARLTAASFL
jgi:hypothetical protein